MAKISNTEEGNQYYKLINEYIEKYIITHKIKPSNVKKYFKNSKNRTSFLERYKLNDIVGIKRVLDDVIDDWHSVEKDAVMKFENFINEDMGSMSIDASGMEYERILADLYGTSVGHVEVTDNKDHKYNVTDFGKKIDVIIYSDKDIENFNKSLLPILIKEANEFTIDIHQVDVGLKSGKELKTYISFPLSSVVSEEKLSEYLNKELSLPEYGSSNPNSTQNHEQTGGRFRNRKMIQLISNFINDYDILKAKKKYMFKERYRKYYIWELIDSGSVPLLSPGFYTDKNPK